MLPSDKGSDTQTTRVRQGPTEDQGRLLGRGHLWFSSHPSARGTGGNFAKMPMLLLSGDGCLGIQPGPCFLHPSFILLSESRPARRQIYQDDVWHREGH